jgi:putative hemolysin
VPELYEPFHKIEIMIKFVLESSVMNATDHRKSRRDLPVITEKFIDIEKIFSSKNPRLARSMPGFIFRLLKRIIHQDEINDFMFRNREKWGLDYVRAILEDFGVKTGVVNPPVLNKDNRYLIASNHPLGGMDGIALLHEAGKLKKEVVFPVNDLLLNLPNLYELFIPVNKHGSNAENIRLFNETFDTDVLILYFPAGLVSRKQKKVVKDVEWKKTFLTKARAYKRDIIPVHISGRNTNFFYNLANFRKRLGIKANIEMLFLPDEMYKYKNKTILITFGKPIPVSVFDKSKSDQQWATLLREHVYKLENNPDQEFTF